MPLINHSFHLSPSHYFVKDSVLYWKVGNILKRFNLPKTQQMEDLVFSKDHMDSVSCLAFNRKFYVGMSPIILPPLSLLPSPPVPPGPHSMTCRASSRNKKNKCRLCDTCKEKRDGNTHVQSPRFCVSVSGCARVFPSQRSCI